MQTYGGITRTPDGEVFALQQPGMGEDGSEGPGVIEWRSFDDLLPARTSVVPEIRCEIESLDSSPDGRWLVIDNNDHIFLLDWHTGGVELVAYEVLSGKRLWRACSEEESTGRWIFTPDGRALLLPVQGSEVLVYDVESGALSQRLRLGLDEPVQALAFDHDGRTLWLATEMALSQYQTQS